MALGAPVPIRCRVSSSQGPKGGQSLWIGTMVTSGRLIESSNTWGEDGVLAKAAASINGSQVSDDISFASSVTPTAKLEKEYGQISNVRCVASPSGVTELPAVPVIRPEPRKKSVSLFSGFYI
mmetsp:Transcript_59369/g.176284  ORF Transcript_59369/g.176284 Transcript_59369/m.176284 type:complete len:123 (-) Transcript_59369:22-390(-)